eukprot:TRINITY_DN2570_c1_g1_i1.p1 TRINITY_DN2570_c1_g1~~TRINITY_DN2570_c1_g1_i1.p1  ORF type:complete len:555 (+),score=66.92 TRINITY_DN2570_c1_g1_i1:69-1667(+)
MTDSGDHQVSSIKCGHVFGFSCISAHISRARSCFLCSKRSAKTEITRLYPNSLQGFQMESIEEWQTALRVEKERTGKLHSARDRDMAALRTRQADYEKAVELYSSLKQLTNAQLQQRRRLIEGPSKQFQMHCFVRCEGNLDLPPRSCFAQDGERLFVGNSGPGLVVIDIRKGAVSSAIPLPCERVLQTRVHSLHSAIVVSPSKVTMMDTRTFHVVQRLKTGLSATCCCPHPLQSDLLYLGGRDGEIELFDLRNASRALHTARQPDWRTSPVLMLETLTSPARTPSEFRAAQPESLEQDTGSDEDDSVICVEEEIPEAKRRRQTPSEIGRSGNASPPPTLMGGLVVGTASGLGCLWADGPELVPERLGDCNDNQLLAGRYSHMSFAQSCSRVALCDTQLCEVYRMQRSQYAMSAQFCCRVGQSDGASSPTEEKTASRRYTCSTICNVEFSEEDCVVVDEDVRVVDTALFVACATPSSIVVWDAVTAQPLQRLTWRASAAPIADLSFLSTPRSNVLAACTSAGVGLYHLQHDDA